MTKPMQIAVHTTEDHSFTFTGYALTERWTPKWRYYKADDGEVLEFRERFIVAVETMELEEENND